VQSANPAALKVIDFSKLYYGGVGDGGPSVFLAFWGAPVDHLVWSVPRAGGAPDAQTPILYINALNQVCTLDIGTYAKKQWTTSATVKQRPAWNNVATYLTTAIAPDLIMLNAGFTASSNLTAAFAENASGRQEWSPDGTKLAFNTVDGGGQPKDIWVLNVSLGAFTNLTGGVGKNESPSWTRDGRYLIWSRDTGNGDGFQLWRMAAADGIYKEQITHPSDFPAGIEQALEPCVSPDEDRVAFTLYYNDGASVAYDIATYDPAAGGPQERTTDGTSRYPTWGPQGDRIAYQSQRDGNWEVYMLDTNNTSLPPTNLTLQLGDQTRPAWKCHGYYRVPLGPVGTDAGLNPPLGTTAAAVIATVGDGSEELSYFGTYAINSTQQSPVTLTEVVGQATLPLIDVMTTSALVIKEDLLRGQTPRDILGGTKPWVPGSIQRAILSFDPVSGLLMGVVSFAGTVTPVQVGGAAPYTASAQGDSTVLEGAISGVWLPDKDGGQYQAGPFQRAVIGPGGHLTVN